MPTTLPHAPTARTSTARTGMAPPARRRARSGRDPRLFVGLGLVAVSMLVGSLVMSRADRTVPVWSAARDLPAGSVLTADDLRQVQVRLDTTASSYLTAAGAPVGARVIRDVGAGELLPTTAVGARSASPRRLVTVPVEQFHAPAGLARGELVDVYVTPRSDAGRDGPSTVVAERATVAAVEEDGGRFGSSARSVGVVLSLDPQLVSRVVSGARRGSVDLVRVPMDAK